MWVGERLAARVVDAQSKLQSLGGYLTRPPDIRGAGSLHARARADRSTDLERAQKGPGNFAGILVR